MTELNYQTPAGNSRTITAAWISLLVLGVFYSLGGACFGVVFLALVFGAVGGGSRDLMGIVIGMAIILFIVASGIFYCWGSIRVSKRSRPEAKVNFVLTTIHASLVVALCILGVVAAIIRGRGVMTDDVVAIFMGVLFYLTIAAGNGFCAWFLWQAMKELKLQ